MLANVFWFFIESNLVISISSVATLLYYFFTKKIKNPFYYNSLGIWAIVVHMGVRILGV